MTHDVRATATGVWFAVAMVAALVLSLLVGPVQPARADQAPTGVQVEQGYGFATVSWDEVEGADEYHIERTILDGDEPAGPAEIVGVWTPDPDFTGGEPDRGAFTFADSGFVLGERYQWRVRAVSATVVTIDEPAPAAGSYETAGAAFGPAVDDTGVTSIALVDDGNEEMGDFPFGGTGSPTEGCGPLIDFPAGAIALIDRGRCTFVEKVSHAQAAGAVAAIVANNTGGPPTFMTGTDPNITIPSVMVSQQDGETIKTNLPATGRVHTPVTPFSDPVAGDTRGLVGPEEFHTGFELAGGLEWTTFEEEVAVLEAIADASDRVRLETIGETYEGRPLHLATVGYPEPLAKQEIAASASVFITCTIHGIERSGREACLILLRELAFSDDPRIIDILENATVLINPTANPDGRAVGRRTNTAGQDMNRDHLLLRHPEAVALSEVQRDHLPEILVDAHELGNGPDIEWLPPRSLTVHEDLFTLSFMDYVRGRLFGAADETGWSRLQYRATPANNWEAWNANVPGLKNHIGLLQETPRGIPPSRPAEGPVGVLDHPGSQQRRVYSHLWALHETLDYHRQNLPTIQNVIATSEAAQSANLGPIYLDGRYDFAINPPTNQAPTTVLDPYCGYRLSPEQYAVRDSGTLIGPLAGQPWQSGTVEQRLAAHGVEVDEIGSGIVQVPLAQRLRAVLPYILDPELITPTRSSLPNLSMVEATRLDDRRPTVVVGEVDSGVPNRVDDVSCSINDLIADEQVWPTHGRFLQHVTNVVQDLRAAGRINHREGGAIVNAAAASDVGK